MRHVLWIKKHISCVTIVYCLMVSAGSVVAQDSAKVSQTNATPQANATSPAVTQPSFSSIAEIEIQARRDAQADIKGQTWFLIGCLTNLTGWLIAYIIEPSPPVSRLLGKSGDYIAVYTDTYKREGKKIQTRKAFTGCVVGVLCVAAVEVIAILIMANTMPSSTTTYY